MDSYGTGMPQRNLLQSFNLCSDIFFSLDMMHPEALYNAPFLPCYSDLYWQESFFWRNHRKKTYKRGLRDLFNEFNLHSSRSRWQLLMASAVSSVIFIASILNLPRAMWAGIAAMSVLLPFRTDIKKHVCGRIPGNLLGGLIFFLIFPHLPAGLYSVVGIVGGIGVGFSASYGWQAVFNSLGAMMIAVSVIGFPQAVFFRIAQNIFGSLYALCFEKIFHTVTERKLESKI